LFQQPVKHLAMDGNATGLTVKAFPAPAKPYSDWQTFDGQTAMLTTDWLNAWENPVCGNWW
ncbi:MAG TPA: hypothetical protein DCX65_08345, partial [Spirochaetaceae bacterium]|nr:hypothetical protein [Spirochaetaceae bacterium]